MAADEDTIVVSQESPTSRFTAVNGKEQPSMNANGNGNGNGNSTGPVRRNSDERANGQPRISTPGQEKLKISTSTQRENWSDDRMLAPYHGGAAYPDTEGSHKRKRSNSLENSSSANTYSQPTSSIKQTPTTATTTTTEGDTPQTASHLGPYGSDSHYHPDNNLPSADSWHSRYHHNQMSPDGQLSAVLQRETQNMDAQQREYDDRSPDDDRSANPYDGYGNDRREMSVQSDPKKRKRNFSNRTKTGCMTCRKRKKKCDETKPECNNCIRGSFVCSGYQQRGPWPKTEQKQAPIPLQSKTDYESPVYQSSPYSSQHLAPPRREPLPAFRGQGLRVDPQHGRPVDLNHIEDEVPMSSTVPSTSVKSPEISRLTNVNLSGSLPTPLTASGTGGSAYPGRQPKNAFEPPRAGPLHDLTRQERRVEDATTPQSATANIPQILHPQSQTETDSPHSNPQMAAQLALSNLASSNQPKTQKELMLGGAYYFPFDKELVLERERCNGCCWRFNGSTNPNNGVSPEERARLFRDILQPKEQLAISPTIVSPNSPVGRVGNNVVVEAPFTCDYGYNILIGQDVAIGKNCTIIDSCEVSIGDRCNIGPNVNIYTATLHNDPNRRKGSKAPWIGQKIVIENDCFIGGNVTILPGVVVGRGSTVGAGSVVTRNVPRNTIVCGNPAHVNRGSGFTVQSTKSHE